MMLRNLFLAFASLTKLQEGAACAAMADNPYGDGCAAECIAATLAASMMRGDAACLPAPCPCGTAELRFPGGCPGST